MRRITIFLLFSGVVLLFIQSCKHDLPVKKTGGYSNTPTVADSCRWDTVYFVKEIFPIFISYCTGTECHDDQDPQGEISFTSYVNIMNSQKIVPGQPDESDLIDKLTTTDPNDQRMPPDGYPQLTPEQINALKIWISQGAKNNDCFNGCTSSDISFSTGVWPILDATCKGCHSGISPGGGVILSDYSTVKSAVDGGRFEKAVFHEVGAKPMPPGGQLDSCSLISVRGWLDAGAPNN